MDRSHLRKDMEQKCMTGFMVRSDLLIPVANKLTLLLCSDTHLYKGLPDIILINIFSVALGSQDS